MNAPKRSRILFKKKRGSRNENWRDEEIECLVNIWANHVDDLVGVRRPGKIYEKMAAEFAQNGYTRKSVEIQKKVSNLSQEYRKEESKIQMGFGPSSWKFFSAVESIINCLTTNKTLNPYKKYKYERSGGQSDNSTLDVNSLSEDQSNDEDMSFMAVFLKDAHSSDGGNGSPSPTPSSVSLSCDVKMPVIVSVCGNAVQHLDPMDEIRSDLMQMKQDMDKILEENLEIQVKQEALHARCTFIQENMAKLIDKLMDH